MNFDFLILAQTDVQQPAVWIGLSSGLIGAILGAIIAAIATVLLQHWRSKKTYFKEKKFKIYMLLHEAYGKHFWIASADLRGELAKDEVRRQFESVSWKIADEMRTIDIVPETEAILHTLFSLRFENENERAKAFEKLLDEMGQELNPKYSEIMRRLSKENMLPVSSEGPFENVEIFLNRKDKIAPRI